MKTYKTSEMIAMLEKNPKLKFINKNGYIVCSDGCFIKICDSYHLSLQEDWQLVREPVPVWEAIKAFKEGKTISCSFIGKPEFIIQPKHKRDPFTGFGLDGNSIEFGVWHILEEGESI